MNDQLISIIVPIYNVEKYLDECVNSIVAQSYKNLEIILVNDGSPDNSPRICDEWASKDPRIKVIHKVNGGLSDARNAGIDACTGEYVMFVDSDDYIVPNMAERLLDTLLIHKCDIVCGGYQRTYNGENIQSVSPTKEVTFVVDGISQLKRMLNSEINCSVWGNLYTRKIIANHRFIKGRYNEDVIFLFQIYPYCKKVVNIKEFLYYYRVNENSITASFSKRTIDLLINAQQMEEMMIQKSLPVIDEMKNYKFRACLELGYCIQRAKAQSVYPEETRFVKEYLISHFKYILFNKYYTIRDILHALINLIRL